MKLSQKREEIIQIMADAMKQSGRTCDEDSWPIVMAEEALHALYKNGYMLTTYNAPNDVPDV